MKNIHKLSIKHWYDYGENDWNTIDLRTGKKHFSIVKDKWNKKILVKDYKRLPSQINFNHFPIKSLFMIMMMVQ